MKKITYVILICLISVTFAKADNFSTNSVLDPSLKASTQVENFKNKKPAGSLTFNSIQDAIDATPAGGIIKVKPGVYTIPGLVVIKDLTVIFEPGAEVIAESGLANITIGDTSIDRNLTEAVVRFIGYGNFTNVSFIVYGKSTGENPNSKTSFYLNCLNIINSGNVCFHWSNVKELYCKFKKMVGGSNLFDSDNYGGNVEFDGDTIINLTGPLFNIDDYLRVNLYMKNMRIIDLGGNSEITIFNSDTCLIKFENVYLTASTPITFRDNNDGGQSAKWEFINCRFEVSASTSFELTGNGNTFLHSKSSSANKPVGGDYTFFPIVGSFSITPNIKNSRSKEYILKD